MKFWHLFLFLFYLNSASAKAENWFLSSAQLQQLSISDKQSYLRSVQSIVANLEAFQNKEYASIQEVNSDRSPASAVGTDRKDEIQSEIQSLKLQIDQALSSNQNPAPDLTNIFFLLNRIRMRIDLFPKASGQSSLLGSWHLQFQRFSDLAKKPEDKRRYIQLSNLNTRLKQGRLTISERASLLQQSGFPVRYSYVFGENSELSRAQDLSLDARNARTIPQNARTRTAPSRSSSTSGRASRPSDVSYSTVTNTPLRRVGTSSGSSQPQQAQAANTPKPVREQCIYSGFVIYDTECKHPVEIPSELNILSLNKTQYKCQEHKALCNPLLFGGNVSCTPEVLQGELLKPNEPSSCLKSSTGICVDRSPTATTACRDLTKENPQFLNVASLLVSKETDAWDIYVKRFENLCNHRNSRNKDINETCLVASYQLQDLKKSYLQNQLTPSRNFPEASPSTKTN